MLRPYGVAELRGCGLGGQKGFLGDAVGLLQMVRRLKERRKVRAALGDYLSPEVVRRLLTKKPDVVEPAIKHFQFVVILLDEPVTKLISPLMSGLTRTLIEHKATISTISPELIVSLFGVPFPDGNWPEARRAVVEALLKERDIRIRIAHGECDALVGNLGGPLRYSYGAAIPGFLGILKRLLEAEPGSAFEVT